MISRTGEYALRSMVYLAQRAEDSSVPGPTVAADLDVPQKYLSKVMADLVRTGLLEATRGKRGGFRLSRPPRQIRLVEVLQPFEPLLWSNRQRCPFGNPVCSDDLPCAGHSRWKLVKQAYLQFLEKTTLAEVAAKKRQRRIANRRKAGR